MQCICSVAQCNALMLNLEVKCEMLRIGVDKPRNRVLNQSCNVCNNKMLGPKTLHIVAYLNTQPPPIGPNMHQIRIETAMH